ncbi:hypothetical protein AMELA_G00003280 [Ameiurus melas]|uniref:Uncharacterized protein n=1 Tax=Ameiurus melas TaxID=219545 RepID=A0A7J6BEM2_AMEME|nr:hypothetical protein AMELA_G00003280 [Ameiurus melas]
MNRLLSLSLQTGSGRTRAGDVISRASDWLRPRRHATWEDMTFNPRLVLLINEQRLSDGLELDLPDLTVSFKARKLRVQIH